MGVWGLGWIGVGFGIFGEWLYNYG
jgi:hypothetical protein